MAACNAFADDINQHKLLHPHEIRGLIDKDVHNNQSQ